MSRTAINIVAAVLFSGSAGALAACPAAVADPGECRPVDTATVCEEPGNAAVASVPAHEAEPSNGTQNGPYGPAGATPPVGN